MSGARVEKAHAKVNLTLRVIGRRADGYHDIESLVVFAGLGDVLTFVPAGALALAVRGPTARASGAIADNLVLRAARALADRVEGIKLGRFALSKRLPVAAGLGGGSADAAAALRILACENNMGLDDPRLMQAARATGADVPVCLEPRARLMRGIGDILSDPLDVPRLAAILVNPRGGDCNQGRVQLAPGTASRACPTCAGRCASPAGPGCVGRGAHRVSCGRGE